MLRALCGADPRTIMLFLVFFCWAGLPIATLTQVQDRGPVSRGLQLACLRCHGMCNDCTCMAQAPEKLASAVPLRMLTCTHALSQGSGGGWGHQSWLETKAPDPTLHTLTPGDFDGYGTTGAHWWSLVEWQVHRVGDRKSVV